MADPSLAERIKGASPEAAAQAITRFESAAREARGCAVLGPRGVLAASGPAAHWEEAGRAVLRAADAAAGSEATHAHVATEEGEVFAVRSGELAMVAVTSRYTLASLVFADMRAALRHADSAASPAAEAA
ncbi:MAG: hypothetical protein M3Y34_02185 [Actinomycetota bacterium]|nr:hypothetical protein [Actinomycetota bacterium]